MLLASSDCFVSVNAATMLNPLALEAVALGVRLIVNDTMAYDGYFPPGIRLRVRTEPVSAVYQVMPVERPLIDKRDPHRYFLGRLPEKASLAAALREAFADRRAGRLDAAAATRFREEHDWRVSAETARSILQRL